MPTVRHRSRTAVPVLLLFALACGIASDAGHDPGVVALAPVPVPRGAPQGPPATAIVSTGGGTLSSPDGALTITVPAGALASATELSITPIANTARGAVAGAFRLGPEGLTFTAPVTLAFKGPELYPQGGSVEDVGVVTQDHAGYWQRVEPATRDAGANTITVRADHFSDWAVAWTSGEAVAEGPIQLFQTVGIPFSAQGRAAVYLKDDGSSFTSYVLAGTLTIPATLAVGNETCVPDQTTKSWANIAEIDKAKAHFRWGMGAYWTLTCTAPGGAVTTRILPTSFDTMGINLVRCAGSYDPGQFAELDFLKGAYTSSCGVEGAVRGTWDLRGYQILVNPQSGLVTTEAGGTATFQLVLNKPASANVVVALSSSDPTEGTVPASVTFTPANWGTPQTVTVTGVNDFVDDDDVAYTILTSPATTADPHYQGIDPANVEATNRDDDTAGLTLDPATGLVTTEAGGTATFRVTLNSEPVQGVTVSFASSDPTEGTVSPASVAFTAANWNVAQTVTLTGVNDFTDDGDVAYSVSATAASADPKYQGLGGSVAASNTDDDTAGYSLVPATGLVTTEAGGTATFRFALTSEPFADVTVALTSSDPTEGTVSPASLTFTAANWNVEQVVTVTGVNDLQDDGDVAYSVVLAGTSTDAGYGGRTGTVSVTNRNDDFAGFATTPSAGLVTTEAGGTATFRLVLTSQPFSDVVVAVASGDTTEGVASPASVTFTAATWNVPQTITVTGVNDFVDDGDIGYAVGLTGASADAGYAGRTAVVTATNLDDDVAGIAVSAPSGTTTTEAAGPPVTFTIVLTSQPTADVTIPLASSDITEGTVSPASVTFTAANWSLAQTVTVTGVNDAVDDGDQAYMIEIRPAVSADPGYANRDPNDIAFTNLDDDNAGIAVGGPTGTTTTEAGGTQTFTLALTSQPAADVTISLVSSRPAEGLVSPASVTFTAANWNVAQTITVAGVNDAVDDGDQQYVVEIRRPTTADPLYAALDPNDLTFTNVDDDNAGIAVSVPSPIETSEFGTTATFTVVLTSQPTADVTINLSSSDTTEGTVAPTSLVFTATDWSVVRTVTVTGMDDAVADGTQPYTIVIAAAASADLVYAGRDPADLPFTNLDNDFVGILVAGPTGTSTTEAGGAQTFTLVLRSEPTASVTIPLSSSNAAEGTVSPASVTFTATSWNVPQTVTVTGVDDAYDDGDVAYSAVTGAAVSGDPQYSGLNAADVAFVNIDNDTAGIVVGNPSATTTSEAGGTPVTFSIVLASRPTADVSIALTSSRPAEGAVSPSSVVFTGANWNVPQTVTVTGVDDLVDDGDQLYSVVTGAATSADPNYQGRDAADVALTNLDDDTAGIAVGTPSATTTSEAGGAPVTFTIVLGSQPTANVTIPLSSSRPAEGAVSPASLVFTAANWNAPQTVTVTGVDDAVTDGPQTYFVVIGPASGGGYQGIDPADLTFTNLDNDVGAVTVTTPDGASTSEPATAARVTLVLTLQPAGNVTIPISSSDTTEGTVSAASVTFTTVNWNVPQTVTVTGVDDAITDGTQPYTIVIGPASGGGYTGVDPADLAFTNLDNDVGAITVTTPAGTTTTEAGGAATVRLVLTVQPSGNVTIPVSSSDLTEGTTGAITGVTFTTASWNVPQDVVVTGVDDAITDGTQPYTIVIGPASGGGYGGVDPADLAFTNLDNDVGAVAVTTPDGTTTSEPATTARVTLVLTLQPSGNVTIPISSSDLTEGTVSASSVTFTTANWNLPQTVTVTAVDDAITDGTQPYTIVIGPASGGGYGGVDPADLAFTNLDNDAGAVAVTTPDGTTTSEPATTARVTLVLTLQPSGNVTIPISSSDLTEGTVSASSVTFTTANWNLPQTVTVTGVDDAITDGTQPYNIVIGPASGGGYTGVDPADLAFTNLDNDVAAITVVGPSGPFTSETGTSVTFTIVLDLLPSGTVTVPIASGDTTEGTVSTASVTFTTANWNVPQTVTVTGVDDALTDGSQPYTIAIGPASGGGYTGADPADLTIVNTDDDVGAVTVTTPDGTTTSEPATTARVTLVLTLQPGGNVTIPITSSDTTEATVSASSVTFTTANWNLPQTVTVTAVDDAITDGTQPYTIVIGPASGGGYTGVDPADVAFTNLDNDAGAVTVNTPDGTSTSEPATTARVTLVLTLQPSADVTVPISSSDLTEGTVSASSVTFTTVDWNVPQTVTVTGVDDAITDGTQPYTIVIGPASGGGYDGVDPADLAFTNLDNDTGAVTVNTPDGTSTSEPATTARVTLVLTLQPGGNVTIPISSSDLTEGTVSASSVTFTTANWNLPQTVTITAADDAIADGPQPYSIVVGPASGGGYGGVDPADLVFTNQDDDVAGLVALPASGLITTAGGTDSFELTLSSQPTADVVVAITTSEPLAGNPSPVTVTFTPADWNTLRTVTVTGVGASGNGVAGPYTIGLAATSADPGYDAATSSVSATNIP